MSFLFNWAGLHSVDFKTQANRVLDSLRLPQFPQRVSMTELLWGDTAPKFEILDIIELSEEKFKALFKFEYQGELSVTLRSNIEINSIRLIDFDPFTRPHFGSAATSTVLPVDFRIAKLSVDFLFTVVTKRANVTVVFNDEPQVDLEISTTIDELLDDDLMAMLKNDALAMVTEYLKQDLPEIIAKKRETHRQTQGEHRDTVIEEMSLSVPPKMDPDVYGTLSLTPSGFEDVVQRASLSQPEYRREPPLNTSQKKRRRIKMKNKKRKKKTKSAAMEPLTPKLAPMSHSSHLSSPTLFDSSFKGIDDYLTQETLVLSDASSHVDPYENLTHPLDILGADDEELVIHKQMRPRGVSSNYINLG